MAARRSRARDGARGLRGAKNPENRSIRSGIAALSTIAASASSYRKYFSAANPAIPDGGFIGESKSAILTALDRVGKVYAVPLFSSASNHHDYAPMVRLAHALVDQINTKGSLPAQTKVPMHILPGDSDGSASKTLSAEKKGRSRATAK